jgi:hypothetical protein
LLPARLRPSPFYLIFVIFASPTSGQLG